MVTVADEQIALDSSMPDSEGNLYGSMISGVKNTSCLYSIAVLADRIVASTWRSCVKTITRSLLLLYNHRV